MYHDRALSPPAWYAAMLPISRFASTQLISIDHISFRDHRAISVALNWPVKNHFVARAPDRAHRDDETLAVDPRFTIRLVHWKSQS